MNEAFVDVKERQFVTVEPDGTQVVNSAFMNIGEGTKVFRGDQSGIWLGASKYADAPFKVSMTGAVTMTSATITGYVEDVGGQYDSAASGARVRILPDANTGIQVIDDSSNNVFLCYVGGTNVGDVIIGDYAGGNGVKWDKSAGELLIKGDMSAGTITGVTITSSTYRTASSGARVQIDSGDQKISIYDSGGDECFFVDDAGGYISIKALDSRDMNLEADGGDLYFDAKCYFTDDSGFGFTTTRSTAESYDWGMAAYKDGGNYGFVARMDGGTWNFAMNAGTP